MEKNSYIHIQVDSDDIETLAEWKRKCLGRFGQGGIKSRLMLLIRKDLADLKNLEGENDILPYPKG